MRNKTTKSDKFYEEHNLKRHNGVFFEKPSLKETLWKFGLIPTKWFKCPLCGSEIMKTGFQGIGFQNYKCSNPKCKWGK